MTDVLIEIANATKANILISSREVGFSFGAIAIITKDDYAYMQYQPTLETNEQRQFWSAYISEFVRRVDADGVVNTSLSWGKSLTGQMNAAEVLVSVCEARNEFNSIVDIVGRDNQGCISSFSDATCQVGGELKLITQPERMFNRDGRVKLDDRLEDDIVMMINSQIDLAKIPIAEYLQVD